MNNGLKGFAIAIAIVVVVWFVPKDPPVFVMFRSGVLSDGVLIVHNTSSQTVTGTVAFYKKNDANGKEFPFCINPGESREFGAIQVGDYAPSIGSYGYVNVDGSLLAKRFKLVDKNLFVQSSVPWFMTWCVTN